MSHNNSSFRTLLKKAIPNQWGILLMRQRFFLYALEGMSYAEIGRYYLDDKTYKKYFSIRRANSKWSEKNKGLVAQLEQRGIMTDLGKAKIEEAKKNGQWGKPKAPTITDEQIAFLSELLKEYEPAYMNFQAMSPSVKKPIHGRTMMPKQIRAAPTVYRG